MYLCVLVFNVAVSNVGTYIIQGHEYIVQRAWLFLRITKLSYA